MKELQGSASASVVASRADCLALLQDIESYSSWYPEVVRQATIVRPADGGRIVARAIVHLGVGPVSRDFDLLVEMTSDGRRVVALTRVRHDAADTEELSVRWRIDDGASADRTQLAVEVRARLEVPRLLPLQGVGDAAARGLASAAARALERT